MQNFSSHVDKNVQLKGKVHLWFDLQATETLKRDVSFVEPLAQSGEYLERRHVQLDWNVG